MRTHKTLKKHCASWLFYLFAHLHLLSSDSFFSLIFFLLIFSSLTPPTSAFPSFYIVWSLASKLPSVIVYISIYIPMKWLVGFFFAACFSFPKLISFISILYLSTCGFLELKDPKAIGFNTEIVDFGSLQGTFILSGWWFDILLKNMCDPQWLQ